VKGEAEKGRRPAEPTRIRPSHLAASPAQVLPLLQLRLPKRTTFCQVISHDIKKAIIFLKTLL
jgi:hypothetical protein